MKVGRLSFEPRSREKFDLKRVLKDLSHALPLQGPVKDFIHQNSLHEFLQHRFEDAVWQASRLYGAFAYLPAAFFQQAYRDGRIARRELDRVFALRGTSPALREKAIERLESPVDEPLIQPPLGIAKEGIRANWKQMHGLDFETLVHPQLFRLLGAYLDQGIASRPFPASNDFFQGVAHLAQNSFLPLAPLSDRAIRHLFRESKEKAILYCLEKLVGDPALYERYLQEMVIAHSGWYAMVFVIEREPATLMVPKKISIEQVIAIELMMELGWMVRKHGENFSPLAQTLAARTPTESPYAHVDECLAIWNEAFEWTHYAEVLKALQVQSADRRTNKAPITAQAFFCIDDRESSLRSYLEQLDPHLQTFAFAGFYAIDFMYQGAHDSKPVKQCPLPVTPRFVVRDKAVDKKKRARVSHAFHLNTQSNTLIRGWLTAQIIGVWSAVKLVMSIVKPTLSQPSLSALSRIDASNELDLYRTSDEKTPEGLFVGYALPEMADRVAAVLGNTGLVDGFAEVIVLFAHGSSSANNPHFAAYDCGACSGRAGAPNSRAFAMMANDPRVREILAGRGIKIPSTTRFIGAIHDTTRDEVQYFDVAELTERQTAVFRVFENTMAQALKLNAKERCRRFELVPAHITPEQALEEVKKRSSALFEPRPEMNHATNTMAIAGRRSLTYGMFLDRRAFLQSYDPTMDPTGKTLQGLLGALIPVCGGINLEYYFSRLDNEVYGAGTKLPHNVASLLGVANGVDGDIRCGLPSQMVEIQDPIRLLLVIEQEPDVALSALQREPALYTWVENHWVRYATVSPTTHEVFFLNDGRMIPVDLTQVPPPPTAPDAQALIATGNRDHIAIHRLESAQ